MTLNFADNITFIAIFRKFEKFSMQCKGPWHQQHNAGIKVLIERQRGMSFPLLALTEHDDDDVVEAAGRNAMKTT